MPYHGRTGKPGRTLIAGRSLITGGPLIVHAPKAPPTPQAYGRKCEVDAATELKKHGWQVTRSHLSRGAADLSATKLESGVLATSILIQVKSCQVFRPTFCNKGLAEILTAPPVHRRECWGYVWGKGHVVTVSVTPDSRVSVTGKEPYASAVRTAVAASLQTRAKVRSHADNQRRRR